MKFIKENEVNCSQCKSKFLLPFVPSHNRALFCPKCLIKRNDMQKSSYFNSLIFFLSNELKLKSGDRIYGIRKKDGQNYDILLELKGQESEYLCTTFWEPKDPQRVYPGRPTEAFNYEIATGKKFPTAIVTIKTADKNIEKIVKAFIKKEGIEARIIADNR